MTNSPKVYEAIRNVMRDIGAQGIAKDKPNQQQGYKFRGIDDVYNALNGILAKHGLVILPRVVEHNQVERLTSKGSPLFYTTLKCEFKAVCSEDGSSDTITTVGEAMDTADKSSNKAMSAAYKYACMQMFCIPTEGDNDADATTHDVAPAEPKPAPYDANPIVRDAYKNLDVLLNRISESGTLEDLKTLWNDNKETIKNLPAGWRKELEFKKDEIKLALTEKAA